MALKCKIKMTDKIKPVSGSVKSANAGGGTGTCPECDTPGVMLSIVGGYIRAHVIADREVPENNPEAPTLIAKKEKKVGKGLSEPVTDLTDTGVRIGDPRAGEQRRVVELQGATGNGTVKVPRRVPTGEKTKSGAPRMTTKMVDVPVTEEHVREALEYWHKRPVTARTSDSMRKRKNEMITAHARLLEAVLSAQEVRYNSATRSLDVIGTVPVTDRAELSAQEDRAQAHRGPTLVPGRDTAPRLRDPELPWGQSTDLRRDGSVRKSTTLDQPRGRDRFDRKITDVPEPAPTLSASAKRRNRRKKLDQEHRRLAVKMSRQSNGKRA